MWQRFIRHPRTDGTWFPHSDAKERITMESIKYIVLIHNSIVARDMTLETALVLMKALIETYYNEDIPLTIMRQPVLETEEPNNTEE